MTSCPAICRCRSSRRTPTTSRATSRSTRPTAGLWTNFDKYFVSLMKAWYGDNATKDNDWCFDYLPRVTGDHSHFGYWLDMAGRQDGWPVHHGPESGRRRVQRAPAAHRDVEAEVAGGARHGGNRERLVVVQLARSRTRRTASRKKSRPRCFSFLRPARRRKTAARPTRSGWCSSARKAVDPPGDARSETWFMHHLARRLKAKAAADPSPRNAPLNALYWPYGTHGIARRAQRHRDAEGDQWPRSGHRRATATASRS